jgi:hypothetical protein
MRCIKRYFRAGAKAPAAPIARSKPDANNMSLSGDSDRCEEVVADRCIVRRFTPAAQRRFHLAK